MAQLITLSTSTRVEVELGRDCGWAVTKISMMFQLYEEYKRKMQFGKLKFPQTQEISAASGHKATHFLMSELNDKEEKTGNIIFFAPPFYNEISYSDN